jgi:hypothetical protein
MFAMSSSGLASRTTRSEEGEIAAARIGSTPDPRARLPQLADVPERIRDALIEKGIVEDPLLLDFFPGEALAFALLEGERDQPAGRWLQEFISPFFEVMGDPVILEAVPDGPNCPPADGSDCRLRMEFS